MWRRLAVAVLIEANDTSKADLGEIGRGHLHCSATDATAVIHLVNIS